MSPTFRSLHIRNYRLWATGAIVSNTGTWMQRVAQDWLVLTVLTNNSGVAVGITTGLQFLPMLLLGPFAGLIADRLPQRHVLTATQALMGFWGLVLGLLVITETAQLWHVYVLAALLGTTAAVDAPARQTFVAAMVPKESLSNAVGLNSASFHAGRLIGPAVAGVLISVFGSTGPVFLVNAATFAATLIALAAMRGSELYPMERAVRGKGQIRDGLRYVRGRPDIMLILFIVGMVGMFGMNFQLTTALMARLEFGKDAAGYAILGSIMAIGSLSGALLAARRERPRLRIVVGATAAFGLFTTLAAVMPTYELFAISLIPVGVSSLTLMTSANATVQMSTDPSMRGRVMALYMAIFMGTTPLGAPVIGWVGDEFGARWTLVIGGLVPLAVAAIAVAYVLRRREVTVRYRFMQRPHVLVDVGLPADERPREAARREMAANQARDAGSAA